jgi:protein gp37
MASNSKIAWTEATWNPVIGCSHASPGCAHCYAERMAHRLGLMGQERYRGLTRDGRWTGEVRCVPEVLDQPLHWRKPRRVFVCSMGDLFHESVPFEFIDRVFKVMQTASHHTFQVLTKRPERMREFLTSLVSVPWGGFEFGVSCGRNIWVGTTCEDQQRADERLIHLRDTPAAVRFVSYEPAIGPWDPRRAYAGNMNVNALQWLDWVIVGGESGPGARPMQLEWARSVVEQCKAADVACFVKQLHLDGRLSKDPDEWPEDLRVREMPGRKAAGR